MKIPTLLINSLSFFSTTPHPKNNFPAVIINKRISAINAVIVSALLASLSTGYATSISLDGINGNSDNYSNSESVTWFNGHETANSIYGDFAGQLGKTIVSYQVAELDGSTSGTEFFFLYIEAPLSVKNMIWDNNGTWGDKNNPVLTLANTNAAIGLTEADVASYRAHHETHHEAGTMKLDFKGATKSEKLVLLNVEGSKVFEANLNGHADNAFGLIGYKDSVDYLFDNSLATNALSLNRNTTMSFEFQFALDPTANQQILTHIGNGLEFHVSSERGLDPEGFVVPEPSTSLLGILGLMMILRHRMR